MQSLIFYLFLLFKTGRWLKSLDECCLPHSCPSKKQNPGYFFTNTCKAVKPPVGKNKVLLRSFFPRTSPSQLSTCASFGQKLYFTMISMMNTFRCGPENDNSFNLRAGFWVTSTFSPLQNWSSCHCSSFGIDRRLILRYLSFDWSSWTRFLLLTLSCPL